MFRFNKDSFAHTLAATTSVLCLFLVFLIFFFLIKEALPGIQSLGIDRMFTDKSWYPETQASQGEFGILQMIVGSISTCLLALIFALPLGLFCSVFSLFYAPAVVSKILNRIIELLAGIPSVVLGLWGIVVLVPLIHKHQAPGTSIFAASLVLCLMVLPTIALSSRAALSQARDENILAASALGLNQTACIIKVFIPRAKRSIYIGTLLAASRAIGETMVVVMLCGNVAKFPGSIFDSTRTLTATIALEMGYSFGAHRASLFMIGALLMSFSLILLTLMSLLNKGQRKYVTA